MPDLAAARRGVVQREGDAAADDVAGVAEREPRRDVPAALVWLGVARRDGALDAPEQPRRDAAHDAAEVDEPRRARAVVHVQPRRVQRVAHRAQRQRALEPEHVREPRPEEAENGHERVQQGVRGVHQVWRLRAADSEPVHRTPDARRAERAQADDQDLEQRRAVEAGQSWGQPTSVPGQHTGHRENRRDAGWKQSHVGTAVLSAYPYAAGFGLSLPPLSSKRVGCAKKAQHREG